MVKVNTLEKDISLELALLPKELKLLLELIKMGNNSSGALDKVELFTDIDWNHFIGLTIHHRFFPTIYTQLKKIDQSLVPTFVVEALHRQYCKNTLQMLYFSQEMSNIAKLFNENNMPMLFLKGPILGLDLYGDVSLRSSVDLDIFVHIDDLEQVNRLLLEAGYLKEEFFSTVLDEWKWRIHHLNYVNPQTRIRLEVHWRLHPGPGKEPGFNELWERRRALSLTNTPISYLGREDLFLFLVTHGARHGWSRLGWLVDIDRLLKQDINWVTLHKLLKKYQWVQIGGQAIVLSSQLLNTPVTEQMERLKSGKRPIALAKAALFYLKQMVNLHTPPVPKDISDYHMRYLFALMSRRQKCLFIMSWFYPFSMDAAILPLPKFLHFLYLPLRPVLWAWRKMTKPML